jgi:hypothetical protein
VLFFSPSRFDYVPSLAGALLAIVELTFALRPSAYAQTPPLAAAQAPPMITARQ